ncbi:hypothetical protein LSI54_02975 [Nesterenkonia sp. AY15]|uniref:hypothetical protein n=1 Tax=Nesterenkonia sp. AY15 TaxID=2901139 RepID=UPI001F4D254B|nr:hypothetical protein [Nesterenkonia sp. AY15]MCH8570335.1 hypothetical protein [Nesterenkonia sp. AY15]
MTDVQTSVSRCVTPGRQYEMHRLNVQLASGEILAIVDEELSAAIQSSTRDETLMRYQEFKKLQERACLGQATTKRDTRSRHDLDSVRTEPHLWELRLQVGSWLLRQYHAEPAEFPSLLVAVKAYSKEVQGKTGQEITDEQDSEIAVGAARYDRESCRHWGWGTVS